MMKLSLSVTKVLKNLLNPTSVLLNHFHNLHVLLMYLVKMKIKKSSTIQGNIEMEKLKALLNLSRF